MAPIELLLFSDDRTWYILRYRFLDAEKDQAFCLDSLEKATDLYDALWRNIDLAYISIWRHIGGHGKKLIQQYRGDKTWTGSV